MAGINYTVDEEEEGKDKQEKPGKEAAKKEPAKEGTTPSAEKPEGEENVITPQEFEKLEKREQKRKTLGFLRRTPGAPKAAVKEGEGKDELDTAIEKLEKKQETAPSPSVPPEDKDFVLMKVERLEGKMDSMKEQKALVDEKLSRMSEEIGEVRSSVLEREKVFSRIESDFAKLSSSLEQASPETVAQTLEKFQQESEKTKADTESLKFKIKETGEAMKSLRFILGRIKDLDNLLKVAGNVKSNLETMEKERREISRLAAKIETIFSEMTEKMNEFSSYKAKIDFSHDSMHDILKTIDMLEVRIEQLSSKDDTRKLAERMDRVEDDIESRVKDFRYVTTSLLDTLREAGLKSYLKGEGAREMEDVMGKMRLVEQKLQSVMKRVPPPRVPEGKQRPAPGPGQPGPQEKGPEGRPGARPALPPRPAQAGPGSSGARISELLDLVEQKIRSGNVASAIDDYLSVISIYERAAPQDSDTKRAMYDRIMKAYEDLSASSRSQQPG